MRRPLVLAAAVLLAGGAADAASAQNPAAVAQGEAAGSPLHGMSSEPEAAHQTSDQFAGAQALLKTPVTHIFPGNVSTDPKLKNPVGNDPAAAQRGMAYFNAFNCVGCHAANGAGGMGRALTDKKNFLYGSSPANIYLTITQGRPNGMPAWGPLLPDPVIWDLVAYIEQISQAPDKEWGTTIAPGSPAEEQAPAEFTTTANPWAYTEPFSNGQNPSHEPK
jgi:cytochrome c oxidase cbb3-type subunit 3